MDPARAESRFDALIPEIEKRRVESGIPSITVAVAQHGKIVWEAGFGWADRENRIPATEHTIYSLASISKPITTTGLMTLVQAGLVDLDAPINDYLGDAKIRARVGDASEATVRRVANHTSGLPMHSKFLFTDEPYQRPTMEETILRYGNLVTVPGEYFQYSNLGFGILGHVIARVSGQAYPEYMRHHVFQRLGMTHTSVGVEPELEKFYAARYDKTGARIPRYSLDTPAAGEIFASAHDLVRFGMFHLKDHLSDQAAILTDASLDVMGRATAHDGERGFGVGWEVFEPRTNGYRVLSHRGGMPGVATLLQIVPEEDVALVVLSNGYGEEGLYKSQVWAIADLIMKSALPKWSQPRSSRPNPPVPFRPTPQLQGEWKGTLHTYESDVPLVLKFLESGDVHVRLGDQLPGLLSEVSFKDGWLRGKTTGDVGTEDVDRHPRKYLEFLLRLRGNVLNGPVTASTDERRGFELAHWTELRQP